MSEKITTKIGIGKMKLEKDTKEEKSNLAKRKNKKY